MRCTRWPGEGYRQDRRLLPCHWRIDSVRPRLWHTSQTDETNAKVVVSGEGVVFSFSLAASFLEKAGRRFSFHKGWIVLQATMVARPDRIGQLLSKET